MTITPTELASRLATASKVHLLDVREPGEHDFCALPNSTLIPLREIPERANELEAWKGEDIVVYCHHGMRSAQAIGYLRQLGFSRLWNLSGGIDRWSLEVDPKTPRY